MQLIVYYLVFMISGDILDYLIGLGIEYMWPDAKQLSLMVFLTLYFLFLWFAWLLAVWMTEPKKVATAT